MDDLLKAKNFFLDGTNYLKNEDYEQAEKNFLASLSLAPNRASILTNLGATQIKLKKYSDAKKSCEKAISIDPNNAEAQLNLSLIFKELKDYDSALKHCDIALDINSKYPEAWSNKGCLQLELCEFENALSAFEKAVELDQNYFEAWSNRGVALYEQGRYEESLKSHIKALELKSDYEYAWLNKAISQSALNDLPAAFNSLQSAFKINANCDYLLGDIIHNQLNTGNWSELDDKVNLLIQKTNEGLNPSTPFPALSAIDSPQIHLKIAKMWATKKNFCQTIGSTIPKKVHNKIRIAYVSPDFQDHPVSFLLSELFEFHDRQKFEVSAFSLRGADTKNPTRARLIKVFDRFLDLQSKSDQEITQIARDLEIDIAIDLCGYTQHARTGIFAKRIAPIQVNYLGYPGTLGSNFSDYIIADSQLIPKSAQPFYSEKIVYLPNSFMVDDSRRTHSKRIFTKAELNLPENKFIFCCFNNSYKFNNETVSSWAKILIKASESVLWIPENNKTFKNNLLKEFSSKGIDSDRIIFAQRLDSMADHLARYRVADIFLDTLPFNAHTTSMDALKSGLPIITLAGQAFAGRVGSSLLHAAGLPELVTQSRKEYEDLAISLAKDPNQLKEIKQKLAINRFQAPLFNSRLFTRHIEEAYKIMYDRYQANLSPENFSITNE